MRAIMLIALLMPLLAATVQAQTQVETLAPPDQQVLHLANGAEPETLDPHRSESVSAANIIHDLYEGLTRISPKGEVIPAAAEHWQVSDDGRVYTFALRAGLRWSDGSPLVAEDFAAGLRRSIDPATGSSNAQMLLPLDHAEAILAGREPPSALAVQALDDRTLQLRLHAPAPYLLGLLSHPSTFPVHRPSLARWGREFARPGRLIGNGAYQLQEWAVQSQVVLVRNPQYWNNAATVIERVHYHPTEDINTALKRYAAGEFDATDSIPLVQARDLAARYGTELRIAPYFGTYFYGFNLSRAPFRGQPLLRRALSMAVDREVIVKKVMNGLGQPAASFVPPGTWNYTPQVPEWASWPRERRLAEARRLYAVAGYSAAHPLEVELRYNTSEDHKRVAIVIAAMWKQWLGVRTRLVNEEFKVFLQNRKLRRVTQVFRNGWISDYDDATSILDTLDGAHGENDFGYHSADYDALLEKAASTPDVAARRALLEQAERVLLQDQPVLPIYTYVSKHLVKPWVGGWVDNPYDYHYTQDLRVLARGAGQGAR